MTQREAVWKAIELLGDRTKLDVLAHKAGQFYGGSVDISATCSARTQWRKQVGKPADCRTYESQPRRNQYRDDDTDLKQVKELAAFNTKKGNRIADLLDLLNRGKFHSIEQLKYSVNELAGLQLAGLQLKVA